MRKQNAKIPILSDPIIVFLVIILSLFGLLMIYSTKSVSDSENQYFLKQLYAVVAGFVFMFFASRVNIKWLYQISRYMLILTVIFLLLPLIPGIGSGAGGAKRWVKILGFRFQPGEFVKIFFIIYLAGYYTRYQNEIKSFFQGLLKPFIIILCTVGLYLLQPDFGSLAIVVGASLIMAFSLGVLWRFLFLIGTSAGLLAALAIIIEPYRMKRVEVFFHPFEDTSGKAYQLVQSLITIAGGGFWGVGLGESQQKLLFLPAAHTDFIFAVIAEELGFFGGVCLITVFFALFLKCISISLRVSYDTFAYALSVGLSSLILLPAFLNFGIVMGLLPTKGLVLPFIGFGGSNVTCTFIVVGLLLAIIRGVYKRDI